MSNQQATCRGCNMALDGKAYCYGGSAYHPTTGDECKSNYYGGYVCSEDCDYKACRELEECMPGAGKGGSISNAASARIYKNWGS